MEEASSEPARPVHMTTDDYARAAADQRQRELLSSAPPIRQSLTHDQADEGPALPSRPSLTARPVSKRGSGGASQVSLMRASRDGRGMGSSSAALPYGAQSARPIVSPRSARAEASALPEWSRWRNETSADGAPLAGGSRTSVAELLVRYEKPNIPKTNRLFLSEGLPQWWCAAA